MNAGFAEDWNDPFALERLFGTPGRTTRPPRAPSLYDGLAESDIVCLNATRSVVSLQQQLGMFEALRKRLHPVPAPSVKGL